MTNQPDHVDIVTPEDPRITIDRAILDELNVRLLREDQAWEDEVLNGTGEVPAIIGFCR